jgi:hypothetical protein
MTRPVHARPDANAQVNQRAFSDVLEMSGIATRRSSSWPVS